MDMMRLSRDLPICEERQRTICQKPFLEVLLVILKAKCHQHASSIGIVYIFFRWLVEFLSQLHEQKTLIILVR